MDTPTKRPRIVKSAPLESLDTQKDCCDCACGACGPDACSLHQECCGNSKKSAVLIAISILIGSVIIAGTMYYGVSKFSTSNGSEVKLADSAGKVAVTGTNPNPTVAVKTNDTVAKVNPNDLNYIGVNLDIDGSIEKKGELPPVDGLPFLGNKNAKVVVTEFSDYECPYCHGFYQEIFEQLKKEYIDTGKIKFVYKDFPLYTIHSKAAAAANAAWCANDEGKYYAMHDVLFQKYETWNSAAIVKDALINLAGDIGLNKDKFTDCLVSFKHKTLIEKNMGEGAAYGVQGTPTTFINSQPIKGLANYEVVKAKIEEELAK